MIILPAVDILGGMCVQLVQGRLESARFYGSPQDFANKWSEGSAEILWIVDLDAALGRGSNLEIVKELAGKYRCFVGGGIRTKEIADELLEAGAEKICIGTRAIEEPGFFEQFDPERVILALDFKDGKLQKKGWTEEAELPEVEARYVLATNVSVEGEQEGPDFDFIQDVVSKYQNVIVSGGVSSRKDVLEIKNMGAYAVVIGSALYSGKIKLEEVLNEENNAMP